MANLGLCRMIWGATRLSSLGLAASACSIGNGIADFGNDITNQAPITFGQSRQVVAGQYRSPIVDPWDDRGPVIIAFVYIDGKPHLAMRPEDGTQGCDTGIAYSSVVRDKLPDRVQLIAYRDGGEAGPLYFVDHNCNTYGQPLAYGSLPEMLFPDPPGYLTKVTVNPGTASQATQYWVVDPWNASSKVLAADVTWYSVLSRAEQVTGFVDGGHLKIFDAHQQLVAEVGTNVTEVAFVGTYTGPFFMVDAGVLRRYQSMSDPAPVELAEDACQVSQDGSGALFFYSPCSSRQLQRRQLDKGLTVTIDTGVNSVISSRPKGDTGDAYILYTKSGAGGQELWLSSPGEAPALVLSNFNRLYDWATPPTLKALAMVNANADTAQIIQHDATGDVPVLDGVSVRFSQGILANFDTSRSVGDLYYPLQLDKVPQLVAQGVPWVDQVSSIITSSNPKTTPYGAAVITNAVDGVGDLQLMRLPSPTSPGPDTPVTLATRFPIGRASFFTEMSAVAFLENWDADKQQGHLAVQELTLDARTDISDEVQEFQEIKWPSPGIMYVIWNGDRAGIWVARAK